MVNFSAKYLRRFWSFQSAVIGVLTVGVLWKLILLINQAFPFNADEAIVGLMGKHILEGGRPIFFYGQAYMGTLDAYLVALGFRLFGSEVWVIRFVQILLFVGTIATTIRLAQSLHQDRTAALISGLLLAIPTVNFTLYTTVSLGGYGEALLIGNLLVLTTLTIRDRADSLRHFLIWGLLAGVGFWAFGLTTIYIIPCGIALFSFFLSDGSKRKPWALLGMLILGAGIGLIPLITWISQHGLTALFQELAGSAIAGASSMNLWGTVRVHLQNLVIFGPTVILGFRAPWATGPLALPLLPVALIFWIGVMIHSIRRHRSTVGLGVLALLGGSASILLIGFILTPFGGDPSGRYFLPLMIPLALLAGEFVQKPAFRLHRSIRWILLAGVIAFNLLSTYQAANALPDRITTQFDSVARVDHSKMEELIAFLQRNQATRGYTNYWVAYPLAFLSGEELIFYPALPYHHDFRFTARDNRYPLYQTFVEQSPKVAFITTNHPGLDDALRLSFENLDLDWEEIVIGDYVVFYNLSERIGIDKVGKQWLNPGP